MSSTGSEGTCISSFCSFSCVPEQEKGSLLVLEDAAFVVGGDASSSAGMFLYDRISNPHFKTYGCCWNNNN
jgi:hypothetical protein